MDKSVKIDYLNRKVTTITIDKPDHCKKCNKKELKITSTTQWRVKYWRVICKECGHSYLIKKEIILYG